MEGGQVREEIAPDRWMGHQVMKDFQVMLRVKDYVPLG